MEAASGDDVAVYERDVSASSTVRFPARRPQSAELKMSSGSDENASSATKLWQLGQPVALRHSFIRPSSDSSENPLEERNFSPVLCSSRVRGVYLLGGVMVGRWAWARWKERSSRGLGGHA
ncbi:hypothetical protein SELMODRAFT_407883 [Selaginella moellendorffii]|uniref:Uncharacterized protein n=1 Tax=Selaginella moellendorffii TaxID=88036 RepID=D8R528_SELML|nr:hypothetical protein SELMODRAFT_407883 [Selaginella moellendorffii]